MIAERVAAVRERIARAAVAAGRSADDVTLVAVSKTFPAAAVREAFDAGVRHFGENKIQEAAGKVAELADLRSAGLVWHGIGHVQGNKARRALELFDVIQCVDSVSLARRLDRLAADAGRAVRALVQVDLAGEQTKHGLLAGDLLAALEQMATLESLRLEGLMLLPPWDQDPEAARPWFARLRRLRDEALSAGLLGGRELSMGMSHDLGVAIGEGATLVRVGTAIFGTRPRKED